MRMQTEIIISVENTFASSATSMDLFTHLGPMTVSFWRNPKPTLF